MITENVLLSKDFSWTDIENPKKIDVPFLHEEFQLPVHYLYDCIRPEELPKYEKAGKVFFFLLRIYDTTPSSNEISIPKLSNKLAIFIYEGKVITLHNEEIKALRKFIDLKQSEPEQINVRSFVHELLRISILSFEESIKELQKNYETYESDVLSRQSGRISNTNVYRFRRKIYIIKIILHLMQQALYNSKEFWNEDTFLQQDIKENIEQLYFRLDTLTHNSDQLFALNLSINEQRNNDVIKVLTIFSSIMLPLTFIASFYGMNFEFLPGIHSTAGLVTTIVLMVTVTFMTIWYFGRKQWFKSM